MILQTLKDKILNIDKTTKSSVINMLLKPISMLLSIVHTPLLLAYLGDEKYGLWATLLSIINWINYFDVGIGNGLRNIISKELSEEAYEEVKKSISTAYLVLMLIASSLYLLLLILIVSLNWNLVFSTNIDMKMPLFISFTFIIVNFILSLVNTILYALQLSERISIFGCVIQSLNLIGLLILGKNSDGSLILMSLLYGSTTMIVNIFNTLSISKKRAYLRPSIRYFCKRKIKDICQLGVKFFVIQIMALVLFTTDNMLITHYLGAEEVTPFSIADKIFNTAYTVLAAFLVPYWSRSTVAFSQNDYKWISNSIKKVCKVGLLFLIGYLVLLMISKPLVFIWLGKQLNFQYGLLSLMCLFYIMYSILAIECKFINGSGKINVQLIVFCIAGIINIPLSIFLGINCGLGSLGIRLATTILVFVEIIILGINLFIITKDTFRSSVEE